MVKKNQYLTLGGLLVALHLIFVFMSKVFVGSEIILVIFLPLLSTIYSLKFDFKATLMFIVATFLLCALFEPIATFIYVVPALICGSVYGILRKRQVKNLSLLYFSSLAHSVSLLIAFVSIVLLFNEVDFLSIFKTFINKDGAEFYASAYLLFILLGVFEAFLLHIINTNELKKLGYSEIEDESSTPVWINIGLVIVVPIYLIFAVVNPLLTCYVFPFLVAFSIPNIVEFITFGKKKWIYFIVGIFILINIFLFKYVNPILYPSLLLLCFLPLIVENFSRVLYTNLIKYSNNGENKIE